MKHKIILLINLLVISNNYCRAQIGIGTANPHESSVLDVKSKTKGFLPPRLTKEQTLNIVDPAEGLLVYCTNCCEGGNLTFYNGTIWYDIEQNCIGCETQINFNNKKNFNNLANIVSVQKNFTGDDAPSTLGLGAYATHSLEGAFDPLSGKYYIVEPNYHRVLRFASVDDFILNKEAEFVFGQPDFTTNTSGLSANKFNKPYSIQVDNLGNLWVGEVDNNRIVRFTDAANINTPSPNADLVLGQPNFTTTSISTFSQSNLRYVYFIRFDENYDLWVSQNGAVVKFNNPNSLSNFAPADLMLGHDNWNTDDIPGPVGANNLTWMRYIAIKNDTLYAADSYNRIFRYNNASSKSLGDPADDVFFQPNFTTTTTGLSNNKANGIWGFDFLDDDLYISDLGNNRILILRNANNKPGNSPADEVLGQDDFVSNTLYPTSGDKIRYFSKIETLPFDGNSIVIMHSGVMNRVLGYNKKYLSLPENMVSSYSSLNAEAVTGTITEFSIISNPSIGGSITITNTTSGANDIDLSGVNVTEDTIDEFTYRVINSEGCVVDLKQKIIIKAQ